MSDTSLDDVIGYWARTGLLRGVDLPPTPTNAQLEVARDYLRACVEMAPAWTEQHTAEVNALPAEVVLDRTLRLWPEGWADFCTYFASDIAAAEAEQAEADRAAAARTYNTLPIQDKEIER